MSRDVLRNAGADAFRRLVDLAPDAMLVIDERGEIAYANLQCERMFQRPHDALIGWPIEILLPESARARHVGLRAAFQAAPAVRPMGSGRELFARRADGHEFPVEVGLSPLVLEGRRFVCAVVRDVTERHAALIAANRLAAIVDSSEDAILGMTLDGALTSWNAGAERIFGYTAAEVLGRSVSLLAPPERAAETPEQLERLRRGERVEQFDTVRRCKDGRLIDVSVTVSPIRDGSGQIVGASKSTHDVSAHKRLAAALLRANSRLENAIESFEGALGLFDADDRLVICNGSFSLLFGCMSPDCSIGRGLAALIEQAADIFAPVDESLAELRDRWLAAHRAASGPLELRLVDGRTLRWVDRRASDGGIVSTAVDVSADVRQKDELRAASAAKSEFLASMSHELRTPLNAVLGFAQLLQRDRKSPLNERQLERLGHVVKGGEHLLRLIDDVLDLSRIESGLLPISVEPVAVVDALREVLTTLTPIAARVQIDLQLGDVPPALPPVLADRIRFRQVLLNYGSNAIKYGRPDGTAVFAASLRDGRVRIEVRDDGPGIPLERQDKLFQPFFRAGQETGSIEGTGIGLTIAKRLAEVMRGAVGFASEPGKGSTFWIDLPASEATARGAAAPPSVAVESSLLSDPAGPCHLIVYIEDNPSNIAFMESFFAEFERITLVTAPTAELGIEIARARRPDLIILDINLPGMSGIEALQHLRCWPETRNIPVIGLSAATGGRDFKRAGDVGFFRFLTKPVDVGELTRAVEQGLEFEASRAASRSEMPAPLERVFYVSRAAVKCTREVQDLVRVSRARNMELGITGILVFSGDHFGQVLEGRPAALEAVMRSIRQDGRHKMLWEWPIAAIDVRWFPDWSMGYLYNDQLELLVEKIQRAHGLPPVDDFLSGLLAAIDINKRSRTL